MHIPVCSMSFFALDCLSDKYGERGLQVHASCVLVIISLSSIEQQVLEREKVPQWQFWVVRMIVALTRQTGGNRLPIIGREFSHYNHACRILWSKVSESVVWVLTDFYTTLNTIVSK